MIIIPTTTRAIPRTDRHFQYCSAGPESTWKRLRGWNKGSWRPLASMAAILRVQVVGGERLQCSVELTHVSDMSDCAYSHVP